MWFAAFETLLMVRAEKRKVSIPPIRRPMTTLALRISMESAVFTPFAISSAHFALIVCENDVNKARAVSAAEPIANPLPIAAVVLPTESSLSVISRTSSGRPLISAIPPALSAIGPYASTATVMPVVDSIPTAASAIPNTPSSA